MSGRIRVPERIIPRVRVAVQILRICGIRYDGIRRDKPTKDSVIVPGLIEIEITAGVQFLARELVRHIDRRRRETLICAKVAIGIIGEGLDLSPCTVGDHTRTAQVIPVPIVHGAVRGHRGDAIIARPNEPAATRRGSSCIAFIQFADVAGRGGPDDLLHPPPIAVIDEGGRDGRTAKRGHGARQAIVDVKCRTGAVIAERTRNARLVAIVVSFCVLSVQNLKLLAGIQVEWAGSAKVLVEMTPLS